jgi:hypothetical protein
VLVREYFACLKKLGNSVCEIRPDCGCAHLVTLNV